MRIDDKNDKSKNDLAARAIAYLKLEFLNPDLGVLFGKVRRGVMLKLCEEYLGRHLDYAAIGDEIQKAEQRFDIAHRLCMDGLEAKRQYDLFGV